MKNLLLNKLRGTGNVAADVWRTKWDAIRNQLEASEGRRRIDANTFVLHWWLSQEEYAAKRKLFGEIKRQVKSTTQAKSRLESLCSDRPHYRAVIDPDSRTWPIEEQAAARSLRALATFGVVQPAPLLLSLMRARAGTPKLAAKQFKRTLQTIERYHFQFTVVSQLSSSGGVSGMYAKAARELCKAGADATACASVLTDLREKLVARAPDRKQFLLAFSERFLLTDDSTRDSKLVRYVLSSILYDRSPTTTQSSLTVEHILPQASIKTSVDAQLIGSIGNLILVGEAVNTKLGSKGFAAKRQVLATDGAAYDIGGVLDQSEWTAAQIAARTTMLAGFAYDSVWKL